MHGAEFRGPALTVAAEPQAEGLKKGHQGLKVRLSEAAARGRIGATCGGLVVVDRREPWALCAAL